MSLLRFKYLVIISFTFVAMMCVPPKEKSDSDFAKEKEKLDFLENGVLENFDKVIVFIHGWKGNKDSFTSLSSILKIKSPLFCFAYK